MKNLLLVFISFILISNTQAQKTFATRTAQIKFFSKTPAEDIEAVNKQVQSKLIQKSGELIFAVLIKGFVFENSLMQQHFNDEYMESSKFPKADFKGTITNIASVNFGKDGNYPVTTEGNLTIHGVTKKVSSTGSVLIQKGKVSVKSVFKIKVSDYGISGSEIGSSIAKELEITVTAAYE